MPSIAKTVGLILAVTVATCPTSQRGDPLHRTAPRKDSSGLRGSRLTPSEPGTPSAIRPHGAPMSHSARMTQSAPATRGAPRSHSEPPSISRGEAHRGDHVRGPSAMRKSLSRPEAKGPGRARLRPAYTTFLTGYEAGRPPGPYRSASGEAERPPGDRTTALPSASDAGAPPDGRLAPRRGTSPLPLAPPGGSNRNRQGPPTGLPSLVTVAGSLAVVLGIFFLVAWVIRRAAPAGSTVLPGEVLEVLGRAALANRGQVHLLRCGKKLLLVSVTPAGAETLTEISDPVEVDRLAGLCRAAHPNSASAAFRHVLGQFASGGGATGLLGKNIPDGVRPADSSVPSQRHRKMPPNGRTAPDGLESRNA